MKELLEKVLVHIPRYLGDLLGIMSGPKSFIAKRLEDKTFGVEQALTFCAISFAIVFVIQSPVLYAGRDFWTGFATQLALLLVTLVLAAVALRIAWKCVGGRAPMIQLLSVYCYLAGTAIIILILPMMIALLILKTFVPYVFKVSTTMSDGEGRNLLRDPDVFLRYQQEMDAHPEAMFVYNVFTYGSFAILLIFTVIGWGAYRHINRVSKARSTIAFLLYLVFCVPIVVGIAFLQLIGAGN